MGRCLILAAAVATVAACSPEVQGSYVIAVDDNGAPLTEIHVPVSSTGGSA